MHRDRRAGARHGGRGDLTLAQSGIMPATRTLRALAPIAIAAAIAALPCPSGLALHGWYYFALFAGIVAALILEPLPPAATGLVGIALAAVLGRFVLFSDAELARPGFAPATRAIEWALSGFANPTIWLSFAAFLLATGYQKTGLGRRIALLLVRSMGGRTIALGYAIMLSDLLLAPFTPSNTARSAGTIYPIIRNIPPLYGSQPFDPSARRIGGYVMWVALAATSINSSLFLTALAPNVLAAAMIRDATGTEITWLGWFAGFAPAGVVLLLALPPLALAICRPTIRAGRQAPRWARAELARLGPYSRGETVLTVLVLAAVVLWVFASSAIHPTTVALVVIVLLLATGVITWDDAIGNRDAWQALTLLATLVVLADGLSRTGFVHWFATTASAPLAALPPFAAAAILVALYFFSHYLFAGITAHVTAMMPITISVAAAIPGVALDRFALLLAYSHGLMGVLTPYATTSGPVYLSSGYLDSAAFWRNGFVFGAIFLLALLLIAAPIGL